MYYIGVLEKMEMKILINTKAKSAQEALQDTINQYPNGIITLIYKE